MSLADSLTAARTRLGDARLEFRCCDTDFVVRTTGYHANAAAERARETALSLEAELNAFDPESTVARLNRTGRVENEHVARLVRRGLEYGERTDGVFDIRQGAVEHDLKAYLRGDRESISPAFETGSVRIDGDRVVTETELDLNGLAKGYIVDRATATAAGPGRRGFVSGGGDMSPPTGTIAVESPYGDSRPLKILDTDWNVATSGGYRRERDGVDHVYDPTTERLGARHESVTVIANRDCMEADALATTLAALPLSDALERAAAWPDLEAFVVHDGVFRMTEGFDAHVA
ncbi:FAD:protein FMN transferase [Natrinema thermotolerans]|uniref:FAD:protein FMN transferase n=1 Tax=Natrinema thermotolerans TaxID=121872 RepID=A0AAF0PAC1_9EURY|nr:FAD:protein FMN transferase [Natrinema thermotolerans]QCC61701.1 FAD:protein FMN transferase [Natrinema thermotolerans]WMT07882.1 FAD:protein FMN transferase [Natrinema thermotolerans]